MISLKRFYLYRNGLTLMELILSVSLLSILVAASFGTLYWQAKTYYHVERRSEAMAQLTNTYMLIYKEVKSWSRASIDTTGHKVLKRLTHSDFSYNSSTKILSFNGAPILKDAVASFTWLKPLGGDSIVVGVLQKQINNGGKLINIVAIKFVIYPRNQ